jgi:GR25 family glycosyltransferase involved in LPS biosynthesis
MKAFVINLKRRPDRLAQFFERCPLKEIEIVEAFDAKNVESENKKERKLYNEKINLRLPGERGVFISHLRIWKKIVDQNLPEALIFEDDPYFNKDFLKIYESIPKTETLTFLGGRFEDNFHMPIGSFIKVSDQLVKHSYNSWKPAYHDRTAHCYIISYKIAKFFIELFNITTDFTPVDHFIVKSLRNLDIPVYSSVPLVCWSPLVGDSDIR